ncbi:MAG: zinc-binding dehydrogenase [Caldiserica bacterium]|nr:zinc-binding dehydrogenase [Caldisericota bacterium]
MKALVFSGSVPRYLLARALGKRLPIGLWDLALRELPEPEAPPGWEAGRVVLAGICGSDLALLLGKSSPRLAPFFSFPAVLGHEIVAEVGGTRAAICPLLACRERGLDPCAACARGEEALCRNVAEGGVPPGMLGYCRGLPGGWGERIVAHPAQIHPLPAAVPDERAVLAEPLAVVLRGLRLLAPGLSSPVLIIGAGPIGLLCVAALRIAGHTGEIHVAARYPLQARLARELGASRVHPDAWTAARAVGAREYRAPLGPPAWRGGFPYVIDAAGTRSSVEQALWTVEEGGGVLLLGAPGHLGLDFSPLWFRGIRLVGTYTYGRGDFRRAVELLPEAEGLERIVTHVFPLHRYREALATLVRRRGVKVAIRP